MTDEPETLVSVHVNGTTYSFQRSGKEARSYYGGPQQRAVSGCTFGPARLHQVASIHMGCVPELGAPSYVFELPLIYGFRFDGCELEYRFATNDLEVLSVAPALSSEHWPYPDYPSLLPYLQIEVGNTVKESWSTFVERFPNMNESQPAELVAVVPPPLMIGQSLWGRSGDLEEVCVVFECNLKAKQVRAYNVCG